MYKELLKSNTNDLDFEQLFRKQLKESRIKKKSNKTVGKVARNSKSASIEVLTEINWTLDLYQKRRSKQPKQIFSELRSGDTIIPLKNSCTLEELAEAFGEDIDELTLKEAKQTLIRSFFILRRKVSRGEAISDEKKRWNRICEFVNQRKLTEQKMWENPGQYLCQLKKSSSEPKLTIDIDGDEYSLSERAEKKLLYLEDKDWFQAKLVIINEIIEDALSIALISETELQNLDSFMNIAGVIKI